MVVEVTQADRLPGRLESEISQLNIRKFVKNVLMRVATCKIKELTKIKNNNDKLGNKYSNRKKQENQINQLIEQVGKSNFLTIGKN